MLLINLLNSSDNLSQLILPDHHLYELLLLHHPQPLQLLLLLLMITSVELTQVPRLIYWVIFAIVLMHVYFLVHLGEEEVVFLVVEETRNV